MFDIGFWEIILIAVVALIVVGPERFPGMVKKIGYWVGQFRRIATSVKSEIQREVDKAEQLQNLLDEQKQIVERHTNVDLSKPAVTTKTQDQHTEDQVADASKPVVSNQASGESETPDKKVASNK